MSDLQEEFYVAQRRSSFRETLRDSVSQLTHSKFYSPAFNAAIFDGPVRIYFAQYQESLALKIYFGFQEKLKKLTEEQLQNLRHSSRNLFVMLYPNEDTFKNSFSQSASPHMEALGMNTVIGLSAPLEDDEIERVLTSCEPILDDLGSQVELAQAE